MVTVCYSVSTCIISPFGCRGVLMMFIGGVLVYGLDVGSGLSAGGQGRLGHGVDKAVAVPDQPRRGRPNDVCHRVVARAGTGGHPRHQHLGWFPD
jgi:hypothetical protein